MLLIVRLLAATMLALSAPVFSGAQPLAANEKKAVVKPFRILTTGKQVTIRSSRNISSVMVWTSGGHRVVEQRNINASSFSFNITLSQKIYFLMIRMDDGSNYTEKIGI